MCIRDSVYTGESTLGDLIADAQVNDPSVVTGGQVPVVAFMNPGGIRNDLTFAKTDPPETEDGIVRYEEAFAVQPFNNYLVSMDITGADITSLLGPVSYTHLTLPTILRV